MLNLRRHITRAVLCAIVIAAIAWAVSSSHTIQSCINAPAHHRNQQYGDAPAEIVRRLVNGGVVSWHCTLVYVTAQNATVIALATVLLAFITAALVYVAADQHNTARAQLRAYVMMDSVTISNVGLGADPHVKIRVKNFGQTPAHSVMISMAVGYAPKPITEVPRNFKFTHPNSRPLGPGDSFPMTDHLGARIVGDAWQGLSDGRAAIVATAKIIYVDIFGIKRSTIIYVFSDTTTGLDNMASLFDWTKMT